MTQNLLITETPTLISNAWCIVQSTNTDSVFLTYSSTTPTNLLDAHEIKDDSARTFPEHSSENIYLACRVGKTVKVKVTGE